MRTGSRAFRRAIERKKLEAQNFYSIADGIVGDAPPEDLAPLLMDIDSFAVLATIRLTPAGYLQLMGRFDLLGAHNLVSPLIRLAGAATIIASVGDYADF